jgi:AAA ATPase containing von Willebrand factor type A (vWA) domain
MESALRDMFKKERYYNPEESSNKSSETSPEELKLQNSDEPKKEEQATNEENITSPSNKKAESEPLNNADADTESFQHKALSLDITPTLIPLKGRVKRAVYNFCRRKPYKIDL